MLFEQVPMEQVLMNNVSQNVISQSHKQLYLFNL